MNWLREPDTEPIPGYRLMEPLGTGGFGEVWKCEAPGGILKAIKFVFGNLECPDGDSGKAEQEAGAMERVKLIRHPFILSMDLIKVVAGELLIVMELADKSLHDLYEEYRQEGRAGIPRDLLLGFLSDTASGLDHMIEKHGLQHLDIKPKNLFLIADHVKVADFGLVRGVERQSSAGMMGGITPIYAAPETFANKVSKHSDQYSLAIVYMELLAGVKPFHGKNIRQLAMQHMTEPPDLSAVPETDRAILARALSKNPDDRFPSCQAFVKALAQASPNEDGSRTLHSIQVSVASPTPPHAAPGVDRGSNTRSRTRNTTPAPVTKKAMLRFSGSDQTQDDALDIVPDAGVLRPALLVGVGSFGRRALQQVRTRLLDRVGQLSQVPCLRFLYLDPDPGAADKAMNAPPDIALHSEHIFLTPLQPVNNYRRRQLDHLLEWLPREKLYGIPRSLRVDGNRALGRLAFCDHYLRFMTRLKHELQVCTHPEAINQSRDNTGLPLRTKVPSVYLFISASGGTSGMTLDVGHAIRRALEKLNITKATVTAFILTGAPEDLSSPPVELANIFATLTELNHYADTDVAFSAQYGGPEGPAIEGHGLPFTATYLLPMKERSNDSFRDIVSHLAGYVSYDLTTPLGSGLDVLRHTPTAPGRTPFRGFGTFGVWYPRGLLLRSASRQICIQMLRNWSSVVPSLPPAAEDMLHAILGDTRLAPDPIKQFIVKESTTKNDGNPLDRLAAWVEQFSQDAEQAAKKSDPITWCVGIWDQARDWLAHEPTTESDSNFRRGQLSKSLDLGLRRTVEAWDNELTARIKAIEELPGPRLGMTEIVLNQLLDTSAGAMENLEMQLAVIGQKREQAKIDAQIAINASQTQSTGFSLFGSRTTKCLREVVTQVRKFIDLRVLEDLTTAAALFYRKITTKFDEMLLNVKAARERVSQLSELMEAPIILASESQVNAADMNADSEATQTTIHGSNTMRVVLPNGEDHLDRSAADLLNSVPPECLIQLETMLTKVVLDSRGGLVGVSVGTTDLIVNLANPLIDQATVFLADLLPSEDVTQVEISAARGQSDELTRRVQTYVRSAAPLTGGPAEAERTFVLHPDSEPGREYARAVAALLPNAYTIPARGPATDLLYCREQTGLRTADLFRLIDPCWDAYHQYAENMQANPHSRFDVAEWLPLVE